MDSGKSEEEEQDAISKQIVDYYKKYSQNKHLPKYFSGSSLSYMPPIVKEEEFVSKSEPIIIIEEPPVDLEEAAEPKNTSPTSSITSNRKLEWDNGADIGYSNCDKSKLQKSHSLPILTDAISKKPEDKTVERETKLSTQIVAVFSYSSSSPMDDALIKPQSSSSSQADVQQKQVISSSSSLSDRTEPPIQSSSSSISYLKTKIGSPDAKSTPIDPQPMEKYPQTPFIPKAKTAKVRKKVINLCITKPISIQCFDNRKKGDKNIQTSITEGLSKCVQTGESLDAVNDPNQSVIVINYDSQPSNVESDIASRCDSFKYYGNNFNVGDTLKRCYRKSDLASSSESSKDQPLLAQLITEKQSKNLIGDINKSIELLQKLLKSKKYDAVTKKRYIKKIVEKITDSKYDDSSSSELFVPKKQEPQQKLEENIPWCPPQISKFTVKTFSNEFLPTNCLEKQQNTSSGSYQSWKENKTLSERIHEQKHKGEGDHLVEFAMKERQHQLEWIKDEISHLTKLKGLLETKVQKTTTVYMLSQKYNCQCSDQCSCSDSSKSARNYVIQTELSGSTSSDVPWEYNVKDENGKSRNYRVKDLSAKPEDMNINRKVVGDIEVESDGKTTNIKVKTRNADGFKPRVPSLVGTRKYDTFPKSKAEEQEVCWPCGLKKADGQLRLGEPSKTVTLEVPLDELTDQLNTDSDQFTTHKCTCRCKCMEIIKNIYTQRTQHTRYLQSTTEPTRNGQPSTFLKPEIEIKSTTETTSDPYKEKPTESTESVSKPKQIETYTETELPKTDESVKNLVNIEIQTDVKSQTDTCTCCEDKEIQTCHCKNDKCVQSQSRTERDISVTSQSSTLSSSTSGTYTSTSNGTSESLKSCICCKRKNVTAKHLYALRKKLSDQAYPLCRPCYRQNRRSVYNPNFFTSPGHVCNCYTVVQTKTLDEIKKTINDLNELEEFCTCAKTYDRNGSDYCKYCKCKLKKTSKNKNGIAYVLTFDETLQKETPKKRHKKAYLEEIKIKIPVAYKKKHKDKENKRKKAQSYESEEASTSESQKAPNYTLHEYLKQNRPNFVKDAEGRRKTVNQSRKQREEMSDYNKLLFLKKCQEDCEKNAKRLFSAKEMKEITKKNYKKLPEVQQKLINNREKQLRQASRLMADTFNRKLRENVLKGKRDLPSDVNVINL